ncbi:MAG TPA: NUDIX hydrolase [Longilinea sp.]|nr:NUDIX hydrolase [Longilinea sp.]
MTCANSAIRFCPNCGTPVITRHVFGSDRPACPACGYIHFADPKVAAAALVIVDGKVLLARRLNEPFQGYWTLPAGFVDACEDPARAAERECREETGLLVKVTGLYKVITGREHDAGADIVLVYSAIVVGGILEAGDDAGEAAWFTLDNLPPLAFRATIESLNGE